MTFQITLYKTSIKIKQKHFSVQPAPSKGLHRKREENLENTKTGFN